MYGVEVDVVHGIDERLVLLRRALFFAVALEREVLSVRMAFSIPSRLIEGDQYTYADLLSSTYL